MRTTNLTSSIKVAAQKKVANLTQKLSLSPTASNASSIADSVAKVTSGPDAKILDILKRIEACAINGGYVITEKLAVGSVKKVTKYFADKNYIVACNEKPTRYPANTMIAWCGSKRWAKMNFGGNLTDLERAGEVISYLVSIADSELGPEYKWINPVTQKLRSADDYDLRVFARAVAKMK